MAQTTNYEIANSSGLIFRGRVNEVFAAVQSNNSGATEPTGTVAYQLWYDTTNNILKMRNASNAAWIGLFTVDQTNGVWSVNSSSSSDALRITQTGTGNALLVEDSANPDSTPFVITADGDVGIGITTPTVKLDVVGTTNSTNFTRGGSQVYSRNNILGTVSQTSGVPTGAIIERGSNANGEFVKYADGTQICTFTVATSASAAVTKTLPATFVDTAYIAVGSNMGSAGSSDVTVKFSTTATTTVNVVMTNNGALLASTASCVAIGRWF